MKIAVLQFEIHFRVQLQAHYRTASDKAIILSAKKQECFEEVIYRLQKNHEVLVIVTLSQIKILI